MSLNITITKKILEAIVHETFSNFGFLSSSSLLDSLKLLGFFYATNAGISINIEDLKTPDVKKRYIQTANIEIEKISQAWSEGIVSDQERFQSIIDSWNIATESLKNRIVEYYQDFDPANNLYIMAFSGARGNMSQVRQLVGMRGLMSDQEGKIIDLPIQSNFREGLSSIDYIISSYGARKGIVDTALKTADSGYLTRRLIYLAQDLIIREFDCKTKKGIIVLLRKNSSTKNLIGRHLLLAKEGKFPFSIISNLLKNHDEKRNTILNTQILEKLKAISPVILTIRSSLTCQSNGSICQKCYGWDLAHEKLISLGENVGIIAAQSIGEPGTQLTMRTFHTGGIFTGETLKQFVAPFSGKLIIPESLKTIFYRTNHGVDVLKLQQEAQIKLLNWKGIETNLFLEIGSYLYISKTTFVYKGQLISEFLNQTSVSSQRKLKPIYTRIGGKVLCEDLIPSFRKIRKGKTRRILLKQGLLWIASGKIFTLPSEAEYFFSKNLMINQKKAIARLKIITPKEGIISLTNASISIITKQEKIKINLTNFYQQINNCSIKIIPLVRNYQYVDKYTVIAFIYIFPSFSTGNIIAIEEKPSKNTNTFFITTEKDIWNIYGSINLLTPHRKRDLNFPVCNKSSIKLTEILKINETYRLKKITKQVNFNNNGNKNENEVIKLNDDHILKEKNEPSLNIITPNTFKDPIIKIKHSGLNLLNDRYFHLFQHLDAICVPTSTILNYIENDFVLPQKLFGTLVNYTQQTDDIVQGLPKIEELIEARKPKIEAYLSKRPGIVLNTFSSKSNISPIINPLMLKNKKLECILPKLRLKKKSAKNLKEDEIEEKQVLIIGHSFLKKSNILNYENKFFRIQYFSPMFQYSEDEDQHCFKHQKNGTKLELSGKKYQWQKKFLPNNLLKTFYEYFKKERKMTCQFDANSFENKKNSNYLVYEAKNEIGGKDYIFQLNAKISVYLKNLSIPLKKYTLQPTSKIIVKYGDFVDIGQPISDGMIDSHELLNLLFSYHSELDGIINGTIKSLNKFQLILANSIQSIYQAQGVTIASKHVEIIVRQMTSKVIIKSTGDTPFLPGELIPISLIFDIYAALKINPAYKTPLFEPKLLSATNCSLNKDGFLSSAGFQETRKILTKAAIEGNSDWLRGLKESIMSGRMIPAGSAFLTYKNYLDNIYYFKN